MFKLWIRWQERGQTCPKSSLRGSIRTPPDAKEARSLYKFRRFLSQMKENDRKLLMFMAQKMARSKADR